MTDENTTTGAASGLSAGLGAWLPIETAPKTSCHILMFGDGPAIRECVYVGCWNKYDEVWQGMPGFSTVRPTYWMPLPDAPNVQGQGRCAALSRSVPCTAGLGGGYY